MNDTIKPVPRLIKSAPENESTFCIRSKPVAAAIVGMAKRNENSTIISLFILIDNPPIIVAAALDTPGIIEIDWKNPITMACL